jgi:hypothetical protein
MIIATMQLRMAVFSMEALYDSTLPGLVSRCQTIFVPQSTASFKQATGSFTNRQTVKIVSQDDTLISLLKDYASDASLVCSLIKQQEPMCLIVKIVPKGFGLATRAILGAPHASLESGRTSRHRYPTRAFHV